MKQIFVVLSAKSSATICSSKRIIVAFPAFAFRLCRTISEFELWPLASPPASKAPFSPSSATKTPSQAFSSPASVSPNSPSCQNSNALFLGHLDIRRKANFLIVDSKTSIKQIESAYKEFSARDDVAVILINQYIANMIRNVINANTKPVPATLEVPSKDCPYDPTQDSILARVQFMIGMH